MMYLDVVKARVEELHFIRPEKIVPCTEEEIESLEQRLQVSLPAAYKEFLLWMGKGAGSFLGDSDRFYYSLIDIQEGARELLEEDPVLKHLPEDAFVIVMHQGYTFNFMRVQEGPDPPVYLYVEKRGLLAFPQVNEHFSQLLLALVEAEAKALAKLAHSPRYRTLSKSSLDEDIAYYREKHLSPRLRILPVAVLQGHTREIVKVGFAPDNSLLVSSDGQTSLVWSLKPDHTQEFRLPRRIEASFQAFSPDGTFLLARTREHAFQLWSKEGQLLRTSQHELQRSSTDGVFSPDGHVFVTGDTHGQLLFWNGKTLHYEATRSIIADDEREEQFAQTTSAWSSHLRFTADGTFLAFLSLTKQGELHVCRFTTSPLTLSRVGTVPVKGINDIQFSPANGLLAASLEGENGIGVYDLTRLEQKVFLPLPDEQTPGLLAFSPDGQWLACDSVVGMVYVWSMQSYEMVASFAAHPGLWTEQAYAIGGLAWSPGGKLIATGGASFFLHNKSLYDYSVKLWNVVN